MTNRNIENFLEFPIKKVTSANKTSTVQKFINESDIFNGNIETVYQFGNNSLHIQWNDPNNELVYGRPYATFLTKVDNQIYLYRNVNTFSSYSMPSGEYSETNEYMTAYDINNDGFPDVQHRYFGRYSASDSFVSLSNTGVINCGRIILGSD